MAKVKEIRIEQSFDAKKVVEWLHFPSLTLTEEILHIMLEPSDLEGLKNNKVLGINLGRVRILIQLKD